MFFSETKNFKLILCKPNEYHALHSCPRMKRLSKNDRVANVKLNKAYFECFNYSFCEQKCKSKTVHMDDRTTRRIIFEKEENDSLVDLKDPQGGGGGWAISKI